MKHVLLLALFIFLTPHLSQAENKAITPTKKITPLQTIKSPQVAAAVPTEPTLVSKTSEEIFEDVKLTDGATLNFLGKKIELKKVSHGLRKKKVFGLATVKVYVAEFLSATPEKLEKSEEAILNSLKKSEAVQLKLTMARDLTGKKISDSFKEALEKNGLEVNNLSKELSSVLNELNQVTEFKKGDTISLTATWKESTATLFIQKTDGQLKQISGDEKFVNDLFSIWFGIPADDKLADLKKTLLK